jgi:hypothetical protein
LPTGTSAPKNAEEAAKVWDKMSAYDKLKFYKVWEDGDFEEKIEDQDFYDSSKDKFGIDVDDVPTDKDGAIIRNQEKQLEPITAGDLLTRELKAMGILDEGRKAAGSGTIPPTKTGDSVPVDVSTARTQTEAQDIIARQLMTKGMVNGSKDFQAAMDAAWKDNNISALPIK